jgi:GGDEF domain-containing protein
VRIGDLSLHLSCSLGMVCEPGGAGVRPGSAAERAEELLSHADREMYADKRSRAGVQRLLQLAESPSRSPRPLPIRATARRDVMTVTATCETAR